MTQMKTTLPAKIEHLNKIIIDQTQNNNMNRDKTDIWETDHTRENITIEKETTEIDPTADKDKEHKTE